MYEDYDTANAWMKMKEYIAKGPIDFMNPDVQKVAMYVVPKMQVMGLVIDSTALRFKEFGEKSTPCNYLLDSYTNQYCLCNFIKKKIQTHDYNVFGFGNLGIFLCDSLNIYPKK